MKKLKTVLLIVLLAILVGFGTLSLLAGGFSDEPENGEIVGMPVLSLRGLLNGSYTKGVEEHYSDTFPFRGRFMGLNRQLNKFYFFSGSSENLLSIDHTGGAEKGGTKLPDEFIGEIVDDDDFVPGQQIAPTPTPSEPTRPALPSEPITLPEGQTEPTEPITEPAVPPEGPGEPDDPGAELIPEDPDPVPEPEPEPVPEPTPPPPPAQIVTPNENEVQNAGNVIVIGTRAMEVPFALDKYKTGYGAAVTNLANALGPNVRTFSLITPNGAQFYTPESLHIGARDQKVLISDTYANMSGVITVDAYSQLAYHADEYIFFRTDHHWTQLGAYYAYTAFCAAAGFTAPALDTFETGCYEGFVGSMYSFTQGYPQSQILMDNPDTLTYYLPNHKTRVTYYADTTMTNGKRINLINTAMTPANYRNYYLCFISGDTPLCVVESDVNGGVCMIVKNSYGNAFIPFLVEHYSKIIAIDPREFYYSSDPDIDLAAFAKEQGVNDFIVLDYPFMVCNTTYIDMLNNLIR